MKACLYGSGTGRKNETPPRAREARSHVSARNAIRMMMKSDSSF